MLASSIGDQADFLVFRDVFHGDGVNAIPLMRGWRSIGEDVAEMAIATGAANFGAEHSMRTVMQFKNHLFRNGRSKRRPACSRFKLLSRWKQRLAARGTNITQTLHEKLAIQTVNTAFFAQRSR